MSGVATKMKVPPPEYAVMDVKEAGRLGTEIGKDGPYVVKPYTNSKGVTFLNVQDVRENKPLSREQAVTIRDREEWEDIHPRRRRPRDDR